MTTTLNSRRLITIVAHYIELDHTAAAVQIVNDAFMSGAGFDKGCELVTDKSSKNRIVIQCDYHHMNDAGYYDGWTDHQAVIVPAFSSPYYDFKVTGRNHRNIKPYIEDVMDGMLSTRVTTQQNQEMINLFFTESRHAFTSIPLTLMRGINQ